MSFQYPLGLLGLIGIPILILIYIIKNKYTEQTVASTYLWRLSERFLRRKNPISRLTGIIALILQILSVLVISLLIAHPVLTVPNAANEYCFILDGSGSMRMETDGKTRFDAGKEEVAALIDGAADGSRFSLILVGDRTDVIFERLEDKEQAHLLLSEVKPAFNELNTDEALERAQAYFEAEPSLLTYLVTDAAYKTAENVTVINVAGAEQNHAIDKVTCTIKDDLATVTGEVISYGRDAMLTVNLYVDGAETERHALSQDGTYPLNGGSNILVIAGGQAWLSEANCPDLLCVRQGKVHYTGQSIICLPNRLSVTVEGGESDGVDFVVG